ncbi:hydrolase [Vibrio sp. 10N.286.49.C2]|uniref:hydrolase n=1 Tax=unclassified Vibrio TaxID=2614977 RepID=UPI000C83261D|nr:MULTISPECIES: hydrolase [unclassified Vibrio]PMH35185.1 hydrolase [Vibrio sp. 10N.286.49.C2]PMH57128.1 hydrolase [Vibrio sp. 10N.286.49.B1]PMH82360.1 hydrolase [Vibrio sp. 10N.286.48.B7]
MLDQAKTQLMIIDVQGKLAQIMHQKESLFSNLNSLARAAILMDLPIVWVEQIPNKLGSTIQEIASELPNRKAMAKSSFSAWGESAIRDSIDSNKKQILLVGIEAHICVYQTAMDLLAQGFEVHLVTDAISSRTAENKALAIQRLAREGATLTSTEMALFELQKVAEGDQFRALLTLIK